MSTIYENKMENGAINGLAVLVAALRAGLLLGGLFFVGRHSTIELLNNGQEHRRRILPAEDTCGGRGSTRVVIFRCPDPALGSF